MKVIFIEDYQIENKKFFISRGNVYESDELNFSPGQQTNNEIKNETGFY